jgi:hypothetical protein
LQNGELSFGYRSRFSSVIWLTVLSRDLCCQLNGLRLKARISKHFGQQPMTLGVSTRPRFAAHCARPRTAFGIAPICFDLFA